MGTKVNGMLLENEEMLWELAGASYAEPLKAELNREVGKRIERETGEKAYYFYPINIFNLLPCFLVSKSKYSNVMPFFDEVSA